MSENRSPGYDREAAVAYAERWALSRNPAYLNFDGLGGDCTNFVSQCLFAGCGVMNRTPVTGWFYISGNNRTASWTGVVFLYDFLVTNRGAGPYAREMDRSALKPGDVVLLGHPGRRYTHATLVVAARAGELYVAAHTDDAWLRPLRDYRQQNRRYLRIAGARR